MSREMSEDRLVQQTMASYLHDNLKWESVYAFDTEVLGVGGTLGRLSEKDVLLTRYLRQALEKLNPGYPPVAYDEGIKQLAEISVAKSTLQVNKEKYDFFKHGVPVSFRNEKGEIEKPRLRVFDFDKPEDNHFLMVRELWVQGPLYRRRPDMIGFVNGIPLVFIELKNIHKDIRHAYDENLSDYRDTIPNIFDHNAIVVLSNGDGAKIGSISSQYEHFHEWKRLEEDDAGKVDLETLLKGVFAKRNLIDLFENFIVFDDSSGDLVKILGRNHQFLGVNRAIDAVRTRKQKRGKLGVFWHTQGAGKSYSMVFLSQKIQRKLKGNFTFLVVTDRDDLDTQIYKTFAGCGTVNNDKDPCRPGSGANLLEMLKQDKPYVFTMIHKFNQNVNPSAPYSARDDIIVMSDEAHRTQYGRLALNMRNALPNASYIGFTGTPLFKDDEITQRIFGSYVSTYDFQRAVKDNATVPLYYDSRGEKLGITTTDINEKIAAKLEELEFDPNQQARLEQELGREYHVITAEKRLRAVAEDFVKHYTTRWETGKAMLVCIDKPTTVRMHKLIEDCWAERIKEVTRQLAVSKDDQEAVYLKRQLQWLKETIRAVVISEEQGEVKLFKKWDLDIIPHRRLIKNGFDTPDRDHLDIDDAFKDADHPFRVAIVCAMWLTGFDVPSLASLYLDKPLKAHTLMQAIARANRINEGKNNGLIVDYCGILKNLRQALATFATGVEGDGESAAEDPVKPEEELIGDLEEALTLVKAFLKEQGFRLANIIDAKGFDRISAIVDAKEAINQNDETRKRFEILAREVFRKFKSCLTIPRINDFRDEFNAIEITYKKLQEDKMQADITSVIRELHRIVDAAIEPSKVQDSASDDRVFDISKIDFDKLKDEFAKAPARNTSVQRLKDIVERRLKQMIARNPLRTDFYKRYQQVVEEYNREKDRLTIEQTFEALLKFMGELDDEEKRTVREGLDEEHLAVFDLLLKTDLNQRDRARVKKVAQDLLDALKREKLRIDNWREKEATKAEVRVFIHDFLWDDKTGLPPESFSTDEVEQKAELVFSHVYRQYDSATKNVYVAA